MLKPIKKVIVIVAMLFISTGLSVKSLRGKNNTAVDNCDSDQVKVFSCPKKIPPSKTL